MELSVKFTSQICHENINKLLDGTYLADFGIDISFKYKDAVRKMKWTIDKLVIATNDRNEMNSFYDRKQKLEWE